MTLITSPETRYKTSNETVTCAVDFTPILDTDELLTGTPTVTGSPSGLTLASKAVSTTQLTINGNKVRIGKAVTFTAASGSDGTTYAITIQVGTDDSNTRERIVKLCVQDA